MKKNAIKLALAGVAIAGAMSGCNVFEPVASKSSSDYQSLLLLGNKALRNADYKSAMNYYDSAMKKNPAGSEAYLFHAQSIIALYKIDYNLVNNEFKKADSTKGLPFIHDSSATQKRSTVPGTDSLYYPVYVAVRDLEHIMRQQKDTLFLNAEKTRFLPPDGDTASDGRISPSVARLDLGILSTVKALLAPVDLDGNGSIDSVCGVGLSTGQKDALCPKGDSSEVNRLNSMIDLTKSVAFDTLDSKSFDGKELSNYPYDINTYIKSMQDPLASAAYNLDSVRSSLQSHNETTLSGDIAKTVTRVQDLSNFIGYMQYSDGIDNDYDHQQVAGLDTMKWHDFDRNHHIRFNYDDNGTDPDAVYTVNKNDGTNFGDPGDIGHPIHRHRHPELYKTYNDLQASYPILAKDTSQNSRINLMKKGCKSLVDSLTAGGNAGHLVKMPDSLASNIKIDCETISPVLRETVQRPTRSDWIGGTPGVDEELLDGFDNDYDGVTDEDSRNLQGDANGGFDDDNDAPLTPNMIGGPVPPMQWKDLNGNGCIDIDPVAHPTTPVDSLTRMFCVGTLEHRLYLARNGGDDSLQAYYRRGNESEADCARQYNKYLDPAFRAKFQPVQDEQINACHFKHIWTAPMSPRSEWTGGLFGMDEEICGDKTDNDGDGWVDEDCGAHQ